MNAKTTNLSRMSIQHDVDLSPKRELLTSTLKEWRYKFGCYSIFAVFPAVLASSVTEVGSEKAKEPEPSVAEQTARRPMRLSLSCSTPALLKRQSRFNLPHQNANFNVPIMFAGNDDCPGRAIPEGNYTASSPYVDSGDTTSANNTINRVFDFFYYYYNWDTQGPDHIYSFTLTSLGANPQIEISTSSATYKPMIYILNGSQGCPQGTGNEVFNELLIANTRWSGGNTVKFDKSQMTFLPLNVPLHLVVDSGANDANGAGPYSIRMQDVTIASPACSSANPISCAEFFVKQHYFDFLNREPDGDGLAFWTNEITSCVGDDQCLQVKRINVSAAFFLSTEFQETGYLIYKTYAAAFGATRISGSVPLTLSEFAPDVKSVGQGVVVGMTGWRDQLEANQVAFFNEFVTRPAFVTRYPSTMTNSQYINALNANAGGVLSPTKNDELFFALNTGAMTRAQVLRAIVEDADFTHAHFNRAFVLMQYFGYLRRNPYDAPDVDFTGYYFWLNKLDQFNGNYVAAEMVKAFIDSKEYRQRFGQP